MIRGRKVLLVLCAVALFGCNKKEAAAPQAAPQTVPVVKTTGPSAKVQLEQAPAPRAIEIAPMPKESLILGGLVQDPDAKASPYDGIWDGSCEMTPKDLESKGDHWERVLYIEKGYYIEFTYFYPNMNCNFKDKGAQMFISNPAKIVVVDDSINPGYKRINIVTQDGEVLKDIVKREGDTMRFSNPYQNTNDFEGYPMGGASYPIYKLRP